MHSQRTVFLHCFNYTLNFSVVKNCCFKNFRLLSYFVEKKRQTPGFIGFKAISSFLSINLFTKTIIRKQVIFMRFDGYLATQICSISKFPRRLLPFFSGNVLFPMPLYGWSFNVMNDVFSPFPGEKTLEQNHGFDDFLQLYKEYRTVDGQS